MALSDVLQPKSKDELAKSILDYYNKGKKENQDNWSIMHVLKENTLGQEFVDEVKNVIKNDMKSTPEEVLLLPANNNIFKPFMTYLAKDTHQVIKGELDWNYKVYDNKIIIAESSKRANALLISIKSFDNL